MNSFSSILTPAWWPPGWVPPAGTAIVVTDVFRATTTIAAALASGATAVLPLATPEACTALMAEGWVGAAERNAEPLPGFDMGNSPLDLLANPQLVHGRRLALTTTNGSQALLLAAKHSATVLAGALANIDAVAQWLAAHHQGPVLVLCAGWEGQPCLEDTWFAGALYQRLRGQVHSQDASTLLAHSLCRAHAWQPTGMLPALMGHNRLAVLGRTREMEWCLQENTLPVVPILQNGVLVQAV